MISQQTAQLLLNACSGIPVASTASETEILRAKKYGQRIEGRDGDHFCIGYLLEGHLYITETSLPPTPGGKHGD